MTCKRGSARTRRHLTDAQKTRVGIAIEPDIAAEAKLRSLANLKLPSTPPIGGVEGRKGYTAAKVAEKLGIGTGKTYAVHKKVLADLAKEPDGEQLMTHIDDGDWDSPAHKIRSMPAIASDSRERVASRATGSVPAASSTANSCRVLAVPSALPIT